MTTREQLYIKFGPVLLEVIVIIIKDEINLLRVQAGLPERTGQQMRDSISDKLDVTSTYAWMEEV